MPYHEDDISAKEDFPRKGSRLPGQNEHQGRKEGFVGQKGQRKESSFRLRKPDKSQDHIWMICGLFFTRLFLKTRRAIEPRDADDLA